MRKLINNQTVFLVYMLLALCQTVVDRIHCVIFMHTLLTR